MYLVEFRSDRLDFRVCIFGCRKRGVSLDEVGELVSVEENLGVVVGSKRGVVLKES